MKGTSFWNRIGLPSFADIQKLQTTACSQTEALSSISSLNHEAIRLLGEVKSGVSSSINSANSSQHKAVKDAVKKIVEAMQKYHEITSQLLVQQTDTLAANSGSLTALQTDAKEFHIVAQKQEDAAASIIQLDQDIIRLLEDAKMAIANSIRLEGSKSRKAVETGVEKLESVISEKKNDILKQLAQHMGRTTELMKELTTFHTETNHRDKIEYEQIQQLVKESTMQNELLRILVANSMIEDMSQLLK